MSRKKEGVSIGTEEEEILLSHSYCFFTFAFYFPLLSILRATLHELKFLERLAP